MNAWCFIFSPFREPTLFRAFFFLRKGWSLCGGIWSPWWPISFQFLLIPSGDRSSISQLNPSRACKYQRCSPILFPRITCHVQSSATLGILFNYRKLHLNWNDIQSFEMLRSKWNWVVSFEKMVVEGVFPIFFLFPQRLKRREVLGKRLKSPLN